MSIGVSSAMPVVANDRRAGRSGVSKVGRRGGPCPFRTPKRSVTAPATSMAVPQTSPSPCAKCRSPTEKSAPLTWTGRLMRDPATSCLMSRLPPISRGGIVRRPAFAAAGIAVSGMESATGAPASASACSRLAISSISSGDGATPTTPAKGSPATTTPGSCGERARPSAISQTTRKGSVKRSARKPKPGMTAVTPKSAVSYARNSMSTTSPGSAPST